MPIGGAMSRYMYQVFGPVRMQSAGREAGVNSSNSPYRDGDVLPSAAEKKKRGKNNQDSDQQVAAACFQLLVSDNIFARHRL